MTEVPDETVTTDTQPEVTDPPPAETTRVSKSAVTDLSQSDTADAAPQVAQDGTPMWPGWPAWPADGMDGGVNTPKEFMPYIGASLVAHGQAELLWYDGSVGAYWGQGHDAALTNVMRMYGIGDVTMTPDVWEALGKIPVTIPDYTGDADFVAGQPSFGSFYVQVLLILNGSTAFSGLEAFRDWRASSMLDLQAIQLRAPELDPADGNPSEASWDRLWNKQEVPA